VPTDDTVPFQLQDLHIVALNGQEVTEYLVRDPEDAPCNPTDWAFRVRYRANVDATVTFRWYFNNSLGPAFVRQVTASPAYRAETWTPRWYGGPHDLVVRVAVTVSGESGAYETDTVHAVCVPA
jgi:hypothetical protein